MPCHGEDVPQTPAASGRWSLQRHQPQPKCSSAGPGLRDTRDLSPGLVPTGGGCLGGSLLPSSRAVGGSQWLHSIRDDKKDQPDLLQDPARCKSLKPPKAALKEAQAESDGWESRTPTTTKAESWWLLARSMAPTPPADLLLGKRFSVLQQTRGWKLPPVQHSTSAGSTGRPSADPT